MLALIAQVDPKQIVEAAEGGPKYAMAVGILVLAGVVAWMAKAYRDDMKEVTSKTTTALNEIMKALIILGERVTDVEVAVRAKV